MRENSEYQQLGGSEGVRRLVERFYDLIENTPEGQHIATLHRRGHGIAHAREAQTLFLTAFLGGPKDYREKHGHMDVRLLHAHVPILQADADNWLQCMAQALVDVEVDPALADRLNQSFSRVAHMLLNKPLDPSLALRNDWQP